LDGFKRQVVNLHAVIGKAGAIALVMRVVDEVSALAPGSSIIEMGIDVVQIAAPELNVSLRRRRRHPGDHVDDPTNILRAVQQLTAALQDFNTIHTENGWEVIGRWIAIGHQHDRYAVLHNMNLPAPGRVETADADVRANTETLFITDIHARDLTQCFVNREAVVLFDGFFRDDSS
jgi:hypothetical protein